ncbi:MAG: minor capsid protein [Roseburia sp.]|nr:minor capsid protein [Roseburia sp.]
MADTHHIDTPEDLTIQYNGGRVRLCWDGGFIERRSNMFNRKQMIVDSEVLRYCSPLIPFRTGALTHSGTIGTVIGSGNVKYATPYARFQYYRTAQSRSYDSKRGGLWFERMKTAHKADILRAAERG